MTSLGAPRRAAGQRADERSQRLVVPGEGGPTSEEIVKVQLESKPALLEMLEKVGAID